MAQIPGSHNIASLYHHGALGRLILLQQMSCEDLIEGDFPGPLLEVKYVQGYCESSAPGLYSLALLVWVLALITFLGSTASTYLSPTLTKVCENLNLSYNFAGVTFLALGNGAPDVFSSLSSFVTSEATTSIGINASLGGTVFICTVVVGSTAILCPCYVSSTVFVRDVSFYLVAIITVAIVAAGKDIYVSTAMAMFALYGWYVAVVFVISWLEHKRAQEAASSGQGRQKNIRKIRDDNPKASAPLRSFGSDLQQAYWYKADSAISAAAAAADKGAESHVKVPAAVSRDSSPDIKGVGKTGYTFLILDEAETDRKSVV